MNRFFRVAFALAFFSFSLGGHAQDDRYGGAPQSLPEVDVHIGPATLHTQIASTAREGEIGLMFRRSMPDNDGMLFVLPLGRAQFWMKNTYIPLSVAFLGMDGTILEIHDMKALDETITASDSDMIAYAIETNLHWFDLNGIKPGMKIDPAPNVLVKEADAHAAAH